MKSLWRLRQNWRWCVSWRDGLMSDCKRSVKRCWNVPTRFSSVCGRIPHVLSAETTCFWETLVDLDGFLFEARSAYEILGKLLIICFAFVLQKKIQEKDVWDAVREQGVRIDWIEVLRVHRILFFHNTAPWLAIRFSRENLCVSIGS